MPLNQVQLVSIPIGGLAAGTAKHKDVCTNQRCRVTSSRLRRIARERLLAPREGVSVKDVHIIETPDALHTPTENKNLVPDLYGSMALSSRGLQAAGVNAAPSPGELRTCSGAKMGGEGSSL
jgi:hypothetical protein